MNFPLVNFAVSPDHRVKLKESENSDKYLDLTRELKTTVEQEGDSDTRCSGGTWNDQQRIVNGPGRLKIHRTSGDHPYYSINKIGQNTKMSPVYLKRLSVTQAPGKNHLLLLVWKTHNNNYNNNDNNKTHYLSINQTNKLLPSPEEEGCTLPTHGS